MNKLCPECEVAMQHLEFDDSNTSIPGGGKSSIQVYFCPKCHKRWHWVEEKFMKGSPREFVEKKYWEESELEEKEMQKMYRKYKRKNKGSILSNRHLKEVLSGSCSS